MLNIVFDTRKMLRAHVLVLNLLGFDSLISEWLYPILSKYVSQGLSHHSLRFHINPLLDQVVQGFQVRPSERGVNFLLVHHYDGAHHRLKVTRKKGKVCLLTDS